MDDHITYILLAAAGWAGHHALILSTLTAERGQVVNVIHYARERPWRLWLSIIGTVIGYILLDDLGELTRTTAVGLGYASDSLVHRAGALTQLKIGKGNGS